MTQAASPAIHNQESRELKFFIPQQPHMATHVNPKQVDLKSDSITAQHFECWKQLHYPQSTSPQIAWRTEIQHKLNVRNGILRLFTKYTSKAHRHCKYNACIQKKITSPSHLSQNKRYRGSLRTCPWWEDQDCRNLHLENMKPRASLGAGWPASILLPNYTPLLFELRDLPWLRFRTQFI